MRKATTMRAGEKESCIKGKGIFFFFLKQTRNILETYSKMFESR